MYEEASIVNFKDTRTMNYIVYLPTDYYENLTTMYPVILFLHGIGERGDDIRLMKNFGIHRYAKELNLPFIIVSPQCGESNFWDAHLFDIDILLKRIKDNYKADTSKICIIGTSIGAYGAWNFIMQRPHTFTSIVSIAGGSMIPKYANTINHIPAYIAHGEKDESISPSESIKIYDAIVGAGGKAQLNIVPDVGHELCTSIFQDESLYKWIEANTL